MKHMHDTPKIPPLCDTLIVSEWSRLHYNQDLKKIEFGRKGPLAVVDTICCIISFIYFTSEWST